MDAKHFPNQKKFHDSEEGQSIVEFLFMLPVVIGITLVLVRVNTAIQVSINNQQYARAQLFFINQNSPIYPRLDLRDALIERGSSQMVLGVSNNITEGQYYTPEATTQAVTRPGQDGGSNDTQQEPFERGMVRVRNTVALCTPVLALAPNLPVSSQYFGEQTSFQYCRSPYE